MWQEMSEPAISAKVKTVKRAKMVEIEVSHIIVKVGEQSLKLTVEDAKKLRDAIDSALPHQENPLSRFTRQSKGIQLPQVPYIPIRPDVYRQAPPNFL